jgi:hypothetical protein
MAKRKQTITERRLEKDGVVTMIHTDGYGITYEMKAYRMGYALTGRVLTKDDRLVYHNEMSFDDFEHLQMAFEATSVTIFNDEHPIHRRYAEAAKRLDSQPSLAERLRQALLARLAA